jgi:hypothetical protein
MKILGEFRFLQRRSGEWLESAVQVAYVFSIFTTQAKTDEASLTFDFVLLMLRFLFMSVSTSTEKNWLSPIRQWNYRVWSICLGSRPCYQFVPRAFVIVAAIRIILPVSHGDQTKSLLPSLPNPTSCRFWSILRILKIRLQGHSGREAPTRW